MKRKSRVTRKPKRIAPKVKKVKLPPAHVLHVEVPPKMIPAILPGPDPHVMRIVPMPVEKTTIGRLMDFVFGQAKN